MSGTNTRTSPKRILNILEEILIDPDNFTAKKVSHKLEIPLATITDILIHYVKKNFLFLL